MNRLDRSTRNGTENLNVNLDAIGNVTAKGGQTYLYTGAQPGCTYNYAHVQPRAVRKIGSTVYCYDANGNMTKRGGSTIGYTSYNLPSVISSGSNSSTLSYGAFRNRFKQVAVSGGSSETTLYVAGLFERRTPSSGPTEFRHYIPGGNGTAVILTRRSNGTASTYYVHSDHLGSPELITDQTGAALVRPSFGAYGERRDGTDWSGPPSPGDLSTLAGISPRGFTDHEHLDSVGLIHMNGRVYDPVAGRFLGVDPILQLGNSQSPNAYAYVWNNPLTLTDPSGFDVVVNCIDACGYYPPVPTWFGPNDYTPPAAACVDGYASCNFVAVVVWDGQNFGADGVLFGVSLLADSAQPTADIGRTIIDATVPGAYYGSQAELAFREGQYFFGVISSIAALADAALGTLTLGRSTALNSALRSASAAARGTAAAAQRGVSVLGHHPGYIEYAESIGARYFKTIPPEIVARMGPAELRAANTRFLDRLIARGDIVELSTPAAQARAGSTFAWELQYLQSQGYRLTADGMRMLPPGL